MHNFFWNPARKVREVDGSAGAVVEWLSVYVSLAVFRRSVHLALNILGIRAMLERSICSEQVLGTPGRYPALPALQAGTRGPPLYFLAASSLLPTVAPRRAAPLRMRKPPSRRRPARPRVIHILARAFSYSRVGARGWGGESKDLKTKQVFAGTGQGPQKSEELDLVLTESSSFRRDKRVICTVCIFQNFASLNKKCS